MDWCTKNNRFSHAMDPDRGILTSFRLCFKKRIKFSAYMLCSSERKRHIEKGLIEFDNTPK